MHSWVKTVFRKTFPQAIIKERLLCQDLSERTIIPPSLLHKMAEAMFHLDAVPSISRGAPLGKPGEYWARYDHISVFRKGLLNGASNIRDMLQASIIIELKVALRFLQGHMVNESGPRA